MNPHGASWVPPCPVCGRPVGDLGAGPCPSCGLPAAAAAPRVVVARIGTTMTDLARDRDALLATLRAAAPGAPGAAAGARRAAAPGPPAPPPWPPPPGPCAGPSRRPLAPVPAPRTPAPAPAQPAAGAARPRRPARGRRGDHLRRGRLDPVRPGLPGRRDARRSPRWPAASRPWTARRGLRATEEALAAAGAALLAIDLGAARALGLFRLEDVSAPHLVGGLLRRRRGRGPGCWAGSPGRTATWPLAALLAAQPLPFLLLTGELLTGPAGVGRRPRRWPRPTWSAARRLRRYARAGRRGPRRRPRRRSASSAGWRPRPSADPGESWTATAVLAVRRCRRRSLAARRARVRAPRFPEVVPAPSARSSGWPSPVRCSTVGDAGSRGSRPALGLALLTAGRPAGRPDRPDRGAGRRRRGAGRRARRPARRGRSAAPSSPLVALAAAVPGGRWPPSGCPLLRRPATGRRAARARRRRPARARRRRAARRWSPACCSPCSPPPPSRVATLRAGAARGVGAARPPVPSPG